jgi:hypothetical protein
MRSAASLLTALTLITVSAPSRAQTVSGRLLDATDGRAIADATMSLLSDGRVLVSVNTDSAGSFAVAAREAGTFRLRAERIGYRTAATPPLELLTGDTLHVEFRLSVDAVALNPITVTGYSQRPPGQLGGFYDRMERSVGGTFITRQDIEERRPMLVTDLLQMVPGVRLIPGRGIGYVVTMRGGCIPRVYLDGVPIQLLGLTIDDLTRPMELEGIEVYRGPSELPAEFSGGACGAIVLWTRRGA